MDTETAYRLHKNERRAFLRRERYANDPIWRLTKLKAEREYRLRRKLRNA